MYKKMMISRFLDGLDGNSDGHHTDHSDHEDQPLSDFQLSDGSDHELMIDEGSNPSLDGHYTTFVPKMARKIKNFSSKIECQGCHENFPCYQDNRLTLPSADFFEHCVERCPKYRALNLIKNCDECHTTFLNSTRLGVHRQRHHPSASPERKKNRKKRSRKISSGDEPLTTNERKQLQRQSSVKIEPEEEHPPLHNGYEPFVPKIVQNRIKSYNASINCKGCGQTFPCSRYAKECHPSKAYYVHCITDCEDYAALGAIRKCDKCRLAFIDAKNLGNHLLHHHRQDRLDLIKRKPDWMSYVTLKNIMTFASYPDTTPCKGCQRPLPCIKRGRHSQYSLQFYIHCIEECEEYRKLGLISRCDRCGFVFINAQALRNHKCVSPDDQVQQDNSLLRNLLKSGTSDSPSRPKKAKVETPEWMSEGIAKNIRACGNYPDVTYCKGCGHEFRYRKAGTTNHYSLEYYKHCIEECEDYKNLNLVQSCEKCNHLFLNKLAYAHHRC